MPRLHRVPAAVLAAALLTAGWPSVQVRLGEPHHTQSAEVHGSVDGEQTFRLPVAASHVALHWPGQPDARVTVAFSRDGAAFGDPVEVGRDDLAADAGVGSETWGNLIAAGGAAYVRVASDLLLTGLTVVDLDTGGSGPEPVAIGPAPAAAANGQPAIIPRSVWGADEGLRYDSNGQELFTEQFEPVQKVVVHHTATPNHDGNPAATVRSIYYYDAILQGWGDIGYNFLIDEQGRIYEGRHARAYAPGEVPTGQDISGKGVVGAHAIEHNAGVVGIALLGTLTSVDATPAARDALARLIAWIFATNGLDPHGSAHYVNPIDWTQGDFANIAGHRDVWQTACPGLTFYNRLPALRNAVAAYMAALPPTRPYQPSGLIAVPSNQSALVRWDPAASGGSPITWYAATASPGGQVCIAVGQLSCVVDGLTNGVAYTFTVTATNAMGTGPPSAPSWSVIPSSRAPQGSYVPVTPNRLVDTRFGVGLPGGVPAGTARTFQVTNRNPGNPGLNVPAGAIAVTGILTATREDEAGWLTLTPYPDNNPPTSTLNFKMADDRANGVTVPLSAGGTLSVVYQGVPAGARIQVIFDVTGYFVAGTSGATFAAVNPNRILDSRFGNGFAGKLGVGAARAFQVTNRNPGNAAVNVPSNAVAVTGNLTVTGATGGGWLSLTPTLDNNPPTSTLNFPVGDDRATGVTVPLGSGGILSVAYNGPANGNTTNVVFDVTGYFVPGSGGAVYTAVTPNRLLDSRFGNGFGGTLPVQAARAFQVSGRSAGEITLNVPSGAVAVTGNLTVTGQTGGGWLSLTPTLDNNPPTSTLNFPVGDDRANGLTAPLGPGGILSVAYNGPANGNTTNVVFDVTGYFVSIAGGASTAAGWATPRVQ